MPLADSVIPANTLTVIIRDDSPMIHCNDTPSFRTVMLTLTQEQQDAIKVNCTARTAGSAHYESISRAILEMKY